MNAKLTTVCAAVMVLMACGKSHVSTEVNAVEGPPTAGSLVDWQYLGTTTVPGHRLQLAELYRFSYVTISDEPQVATARLALPSSSHASYDLVAHLHGTIGFADHCAPSRMPGFGFETPLNPIPADMVAAGRAVVMPDYPGLGVPGPHRYVERDATGRSVWDSLTATRRLIGIVQPTSSASDRVLLVGHSQGGHAVFSALATQVEGDGFDVVGAVAFAPPGDAVHHAQLVADGVANPAPLAWALSSYARAYPDSIDRQWWFDERVGDDLARRLESQCAPKLRVWLGNDPQKIFSDAALNAFERGELPVEMQRVLEHERLDELQTDAAVLVLHGTDDDLLPPELSRDLAAELAETGVDIEWRSVDGVSHLGVPRRARKAALAWIEGRFAESWRSKGIAPDRGGARFELL